MDSKWEVKILADRIERRLKKAGVRVRRVNAHTGSVYLSLDEGLAYHVRISDHEDALRWRYRYNMLTCPFLHKRRHNGYTVRFYYNPSEFYKMISAILSVRKSRMTSFGMKEYQNIMNIRKDHDNNHREMN